MGASASKSSVPPVSSSGGSSSSNDSNKAAASSSPFTKDQPYDVMDRIASELPHVIDDESRLQVEDYKQACDNGKGPMVSCFATGEYISLFERKHREAADLYRNVCFRPKTDNSPNGVLVDGTKAYPAGCFNLAKMLMTGKGGVATNRAEAYRIFDRACRGGHGGACYIQAQILCAPPGTLGPDIQPNPKKATELYQLSCDNGDSIACYTLATMLLRGDRVSNAADNVSPQEARGQVALVQRKNEPNRARSTEDYVIPRDAPRARDLLRQACESGSHVTSCHNLAVMFTHGDDGVPPNEEEAEKYKKLTEEKINVFGGF